MTIPRPSPARSRAKSFSNVDVSSASNRLSEFLINEGVYLGGSSVGKGLKHAARYYLHNHLEKPDFYNLPGAADLEPEADRSPLEDSFYIVDIGVIVSQVYQWRRYFPRVEPFCKCNVQCLLPPLFAAICSYTPSYHHHLTRLPISFSTLFAAIAIAIGTQMP